MIQLTDKAKEQLREFAIAEGLAPNVRVKILGGGCAGFNYDMTFEDKESENDEVLVISDEVGEVKVFIDPISFQYLDEVTIDWDEKLFGSGFKFINPKATGSCGCGNSVSF